LRTDLDRLPSALPCQALPPTMSKQFHVSSKIANTVSRTKSEMLPRNKKSKLPRRVIRRSRKSSPKMLVKPYTAFKPPPLTARISEQPDIQNAHCDVIESPLLRLPPELRNMIFALALDHGTIRPKIGKTWLEPKLKNYPIRERFGLLFTCRQIYAETALLPYKLNTFVVGGHDPIVNLKTFLGRRSEAQRYVMDKVQFYHDEEPRAATAWVEMIANHEIDPVWWAY